MEAAFRLLACVRGLRLRARERFSRLESESEGSEISAIAPGDLRRLVADRVIGAK